MSNAPDFPTRSNASILPFVQRSAGAGTRTAAHGHSLTSVQQLPTGRGARTDTHFRPTVSNAHTRHGRSQRADTHVRPHLSTFVLAHLHPRTDRFYRKEHQLPTQMTNPPTGPNATADTTALPTQSANRFQRESSPTLTSNPLRRPEPPNKYERDFRPTLISQRPTDPGPVIRQLSMYVACTVGLCTT